MAVLTSIAPADASIEVLGNLPFVALIEAPVGSNEHTIIETSQADWATGTLTDVEATAGGTLDLLGVHEDDFEGYSTGSFPSSGWTDVGGTGTVTVEDDGASQGLEFDQASGNRIAVWDAPGTGATVNAYCEVYADTSFVSYPGVIARYADVNNNYAADVTAGGVRIGKTVAGSWTTLASAAVSLSADTWYAIRFEVTGTTLRMRVWDISGAEPGIWDLSITDSSHSAAGKVGVKVYTAGAAVTRIDNVAVTGCSASGKDYPASGDRESPAYDISSDVAVFGESRIDWTATVPTDTTLTVEASVNGGAYAACTNGDPIPGVTAGDPATSIQIRFSLETTDSAKTPSVADCTLTFTGLDTSLVEIVVNGVSCTVANGRLEYWGHKDIVSGAIVEDWTAVYFGTRDTWFDLSFAEIDVEVIYDSVTLDTITVRVSDFELEAPTGTGYYEAWSENPNWRYGAAQGYYLVMDWYAEGTDKTGYYYVQPYPETTLDGWYMVGHYINNDGAAAVVVGERCMTDGPAAVVVRGYSQMDGPAAVVVQGWLRRDGPAAALPATVTLSDGAAAAVVGVMTLSDGAAAHVVYGVGRGTQIEIRSITEETAAFLAALGVTRG